MSKQDSFSRFSLWALSGAALVTAISVGHRIYADRSAASAAIASKTQVSEAERDLAALEKQTREHPDDPSAWQLLGQAYSGAQRYADAAGAYRHATTLQPANAMLWSSVGEALVMANAKESMPDEALAAFRKAHELDGKDPRARYFLATARDLSGDHQGAIDDWLALLADTPPGAPWEQDLRRTIEQVGKLNHIETAQRLAAIRQAPAPASSVGQAIAGPTDEQMKAASAMSPAQQRAMAEGMVDQLEAKLKAEPTRVDGWLLLIRSRMSLGQADKAKAALAAAIHANPQAAATLREQAAQLQIKE